MLQIDWTDLYLAPRDGRAYPADARACDLFAWQTGMLVPSCDDAFVALRRARATLVSPGPVGNAPSGLGIQSGLVVRDPDGHIIRLGRR